MLLLTMFSVGKPSHNSMRKYDNENHTENYKVKKWARLHEIFTQSFSIMYSGFFNVTKYSIQLSAQLA